MGITTTRRRLGYRWAWAMALCFCMLRAAWGVQTLDPNHAPIDLMQAGHLMAAGTETPPQSMDELGRWMSARSRVQQISLFGGAYWLYGEVSHRSVGSDWVLDPSNTLIEDVEAWVYGSDGSVQNVRSGYRHTHDYFLHYGKDVDLLPHTQYRVLIRFSSPFFASYPQFLITPRSDYSAHVWRENTLTLGALGALLTLVLFNLFIYALFRDEGRLYYSLYLATYAIAWAFVFHVPADLFGFHNLRLHYLPFFLLPVFSSLFCVEFLRLHENNPALAKACYGVAVLALACSPVSYLGLSYAHTVATVVITIWMAVCLAAGIVCWRKGYRPARYFVLAFVALCGPGLLILPANIGLIPDVVDNAELLTLLGGTLDGLLLAFALADRVKLLSDEKDSYLTRLNQALVLAQTDALTGIGNRYAFDRHLDRVFGQSARDGQIASAPGVLILIDLDGLKHVNDRYGHSKGDELLRWFSSALLSALPVAEASCYRLGGDEFGVLARTSDETQLRESLNRLDRELPAQGFEDAGVSFGLAYVANHTFASSLVNEADACMYQHKTLRKTGRTGTAVAA